MSHAVRCCFVYPERSVRTIRRTGFRTHRRNGGVGPPVQFYARKRAPSVHVRNRFHREAAARSFPSKSHIGGGAGERGGLGVWGCGGVGVWGLGTLGRYGCVGRCGCVAGRLWRLGTLRRCGRLDASDAGDVGEGTMNNGYGSMIIGCFPNVQRPTSNDQTSNPQTLNPQTLNPQPDPHNPLPSQPIHKIICVLA
jgi:hypothetical protein